MENVDTVVYQSTLKEQDNLTFSVMKASILF